MEQATTNTRQLPVIDRSNEIFEKADKIMHPVTQTLAKGPTQFVNGVAPKYLDRGKDGHVWDVDGNEYIDYNMGIGPLSLGYCYPKVDQAIRDQLDKGITFSLMHELEYEVCAKIQEVIPNAESVRISKSGADVCSAAIRVARAHTGRDKVMCCGYHGWHDWYIGTTTRAYGIPKATRELTTPFAYNDLDDFKSKLDGDVAAVIMEPIVFAEPNPGYLEEIQRLCKENGTVFIFDEMWTGFRLAVGGAQEYFGITPDLAVYSKAVANGMPIAFLTGKTEIMQVLEDEVFFFTTFGGEALSMAATIATIDELKEKNVPAHIAALGQKLKDGFNAIAAECGADHITNCSGYPCRTIMGFNAEGQDPLLMKSYFQQEMIRRGILWGGFHNMCYTHTEADVEATLAAYREVIPLLKEAVESNTVEDRLLGTPLQPVFRKTKF